MYNSVTCINLSSGFSDRPNWYIPEQTPNEKHPSEGTPETNFSGFPNPEKFGAALLATHELSAILLLHCRVRGSSALAQLYGYSPMKNQKRETT